MTQFKDLTIEKLKSLSEFQLERIIGFKVMGKGYLCLPEQITFEPDKVTASVIGSMRYQVVLVESKPSLKASCTCPVEGMCKHIAGVMIYIVTTPNED